MKKLMALVLAFAMAAACGITAWADENEEVDFFGSSGTLYTYDADDDVMTKYTDTSAAPGTIFYIPIKGDDASLLMREDKDEMNYYKVGYTVNEGKKQLSSVSIVSVPVTETSANAIDSGSRGTGDTEYYYFVKVVTTETTGIDAVDLDVDIRLAATKPAATTAPTEYSLTMEMVYDYDEPSSLFAYVNPVILFEDYTADEWTDVEIFFGDDDVTFASSMYKQPDLYIGFDDDPQEKYEELYGDVAALSYYWFTMPKSFKQAGTLTIPADLYDGETEPHLYEERDGKLVEVKNAYDKDEEAFILTGIKSLGKYVVSDIDLEIKSSTDAADENTDEENPETGANDVVAIAAGLAVVSLVAAGAVSLKK